VKTCLIPARDYDLAATLDNGQCFRWRPVDGAWEGVALRHWVRLRAVPNGIEASFLDDTGEAADAPPRWLTDYLQTHVDFHDATRTFPDDAPMRAALAACHGLRLLRQEPWEALVSFICSATKQVVHIRQIIEHLCTRHGSPVPAPERCGPQFAFPTPRQIAPCTEAQMLACRMGFRAPRVLAAARAVVEGRLDLARIGTLTLDGAREELMRLNGVGPKIADCALLFGWGFAQAFPVDVWILRALRELYFPRRRPTPARLRHFIATHFGPHAGWAQQCLFHYMRVHRGAQAEGRR
jgi:N-glycosylase/DNA lyase